MIRASAAAADCVLGIWKFRPSHRLQRMGSASDAAFASEESCLAAEVVLVGLLEDLE